MRKSKKLVTMGRLGSSHGVKGWQKVISFTENPGNIFEYDTWIINLKGELKEAKVENYKITPNALFVKLDFINSLEEAKLYNNLNVCVYEGDLPSLDNEEEVYWKDLYGCSVYTEEGYNLGKVVQLMETGANDVLIIKANPEDQYQIKERLIPYTEQALVSVDVANKKIVVNWDPEF